MKLVQELAELGFTVDVINKIVVQVHVSRSAALVHLRTRCGSLLRGHSLHVHSLILRTTTIPLGDLLASLTRCQSCASDRQLRAQVQIRGKTLGHHMDAVAYLISELSAIETVASPTPGGEDTWRNVAERLERIGCELLDYHPMAHRALTQARRLRSVLAGLDHTAELELWARRWQMCCSFQRAPIPANVLAGSLGGIWQVEAEFHRWAATRPALLTLAPEFAPLADYWQQRADDLASRERYASAQQDRLVVGLGMFASSRGIRRLARHTSSPSVREVEIARCGQPGSALRALFGEEWSNREVSAPVAALIEVMCVASGWEYTSHRLDGAAPKMVLEIAAGLHADGMHPSDALGAAVAAMR